MGCCSSRFGIPSLQFKQQWPQQDVIGRAGQLSGIGQPCGRTSASWRSPPPSGATSFLPFPTIFQRHRKVKFSIAIGKIKNPEKQTLLPLVFQRVKFYHNYWKKEEQPCRVSPLPHHLCESSGFVSEVVQGCCRKLIMVQGSCRKVRIKTRILPPQKDVDRAL